MVNITSEENMTEATQLTEADIKSYINNDFIIPMVACCTCDVQHLSSFMYLGVQCQECFYKKILMFSSSPVSDDYCNSLMVNITSD